MRKTKIICTIGPASNNDEILTRMCRSGMNVARLNFSHGTKEEHQENIDLIKRVRERLGLPIAIMLDTKGPEYRIGTFENGKIELKDGDSFIFTNDDIIGNVERTTALVEHRLNTTRMDTRQHISGKMFSEKKVLWISCRSSFTARITRPLSSLVSTSWMLFVN